MPVSRLKGSRQSLPTRSVYNPVGFDPIQVLPVHLHRYADHTRYFLHVLYAQRVFKDLKAEYVPLKAAYLRRFFPDNTILSRSAMHCWIPRPSSAMGSIIKPIHQGGRTIINNADVVRVSATNWDRDGKESVTSN